MLRAGASGYVLKERAFDELVDALRTVAAGGVYFSPAVATDLVEDYAKGGELAGSRRFSRSCRPASVKSFG